MKAFFLTLLLLVSCAQVEHKKDPKDVLYFVQTWSENFGPFPAAQVTSFRSYLLYMHDFYESHGIVQKFPRYLSTLNNNFQLLAHLEMNLPARFKKYYGHWPARKSPNYLRYEKDQTRDLRFKLEGVRNQQLKEDLGIEKYNQFVDHSMKFDRKKIDFKTNL